MERGDIGEWWSDISWHSAAGWCKSNHFYCVFGLRKVCVCVCSICICSECWATRSNGSLSLCYTGPPPSRCVCHIRSSGLAHTSTVSVCTDVFLSARVCALLSRQLPCCNVSRWEEPVECKEVLRGETLNSCSSVPLGCSPSFEQQLSSLILSLAFFLSLPPTFSLSLDSFPGDFFFALSSSLTPASMCKNILTELPFKYFKTLLSISVCWKTSLSAVYYEFLL